MRTSLSLSVVALAFLLTGGLSACSDDDDNNNTGGTAGSETGGTGGGETGGTGGGETGGTGGGETGGTGGGETGGTGGGETGGSGGGETGGSGGGETGGTGGGASGLACQEACENLVSANCSEDGTVAECTTDCIEDMSAHLTECGTEAEAYVKCIATANIECKDGQPDIPSCNNVIVNYEVCIACLPDPHDDECDECMKQNCCTELQNLAKDYNSTTEDAYFECNEKHCVTECGSG